MKLHTRIQLGEQNMTWIARPVPLCGHEPSVPVSCDATDKDKAAGEGYKGNSLVDQTVCSCESKKGNFVSLNEKGNNVIGVQARHLLELKHFTLSKEIRITINLRIKLHRHIESG